MGGDACPGDGPPHGHLARGFKTPSDHLLGQHGGGRGLDSRKITQSGAEPRASKDCRVGIRARHLVIDVLYFNGREPRRRTVERRFGYIFQQAAIHRYPGRFIFLYRISTSALDTIMYIPFGRSHSSLHKHQTSTLTKHSCYLSSLISHVMIDPLLDPRHEFFEESRKPRRHSILSKAKCRASTRFQGSSTSTPTTHAAHTARQPDPSHPILLHPPRKPSAHLDQFFENPWPHTHSRHYRPLTARARATLEANWAPSTLASYAAAVSIFRSFCAHNGYLPDSFPAKESVLCEFAASFAGSGAKSSVQNKLSAIKAWHTIHGAPWPSHPRVSAVLGGVKNLSPETSRKPRREPVRLHLLEALHDALDLSSPLDSAIWAVASVAFWGQCRLGELLPSSPSKFDASKFPSRASTNFRANRAAIHLPWTKTNKSFGVSIPLPAQFGVSNPATALRNHMAVNSLHSSTPLFCYSHGGTAKMLHKALFMERCNAVWVSIGSSRLTGHSFRIGGTTELLLAGVDPDVVKVMGRWSSDAFLRYWRSVSDIVAIHASFVYPDTARGAPRQSRKRKRN